MTQIKTYSFTSAAQPVPVDISVGFDAARVSLYNATAQGSTSTPGSVQQALWTDTMSNDSSITQLNTAGAATITTAYITSNGISMISEGAVYGSGIVSFTNASSGVITVEDAAGAGFEVGDTILVSAAAYSGSGDNINREYVISIIAGNAITVATNTTSFGVYVSGGFVTRVKDAQGKPVATLNRGQRIVRIGTGVQAASSVAHVVIEGKNVVL